MKLYHFSEHITVVLTQKDACEPKLDENHRNALLIAPLKTVTIKGNSFGVVPFGLHILTIDGIIARFTCCKEKLDKYHLDYFIPPGHHNPLHSQFANNSDETLISEKGSYDFRVYFEGFPKTYDPSRSQFSLHLVISQL